MILWQNHHNRAMKYSLPSVTWCAMVVVAGVVCATEPVPPEVLTSSGQELVEQAVEQLAQQPTLAAKIRQRAHILGKELVGSGTYQQVRADERTLMRMELKLQVDGQLVSLQQVSDGVTLWSRRDQANKKTVTYVNLQRIRDALNRDRAGQIPDAPVMLAIGGLRQLLDEFQKNFVFGEARQGQIGDVPVWVVRGHWRKEALAAMLPQQTEQILAGQQVDLSELPPHFPDTVTLALGRDAFIPLFPYRVEYARRKSATAPVSIDESNLLPLVTMELFEVKRHVPPDRRIFAYELGDQPVEDITDRYLERTR
jgi:hypothetical protein